MKLLINTSLDPNSNYIVYYLMTKLFQKITMILQHLFLQILKYGGFYTRGLI